MKHLFWIIMLICAALVLPVSATPRPMGVFTEADTITLPESTSTSYNSEPGYKLGFTTITVPIGSRSDFTIRYGTSSTVSGYAEYIQTSPIHSRTTVSIGGNTSTREFIDAGYAPGSDGLNKQIKVTGYAEDTDAFTKGFAVWDPGLGIWTDQIAYIATSEPNRLISGITVTSTLPTKITIAVGTDAEIVPNIGKSPLDIIAEWVAFAISIGATILEVVTTFYYWAKFFLWDHWLITVALYIGLTGALAATNAKKDVFKFLKLFIGYQVKLYEFMIGMWQRLIDLVATFRGIFRI